MWLVRRYLGTEGYGGVIAVLVANYLLIPRYGIKGCAWATVFAYAASVLVFMAFGHFRFSLPPLPAFIPPLTASIYASVTDDRVTASILAFAAAVLLSFLFGGNRWPMVSGF